MPFCVLWFLYCFATAQYVYKHNPQSPFVLSHFLPKQEWSSLDFAVISDVQGNLSPVMQERSRNLCQRSVPVDRRCQALPVKGSRAEFSTDQGGSAALPAHTQTYWACRVVSEPKHLKPGLGFPAVKVGGWWKRPSACLYPGLQHGSVLTLLSHHDIYLWPHSSFLLRPRNAHSLPRYKGKAQFCL